MSDWDARFLNLARHVAGWSKDPSTQCGAVIVDERRRIVGIGYNGFPRDVDDTAWRYADRAIKYRFVVHAEANAILNANSKLEGCTVYVWPFSPCAECAKLLIQAGIDEVVSPVADNETRNRWADSLDAAETMFAESGVITHTVKLEA